MRGLHSLITENENWLMQRVLRYAKEHGYTEHTPTLLEAWKTSISGLSAPLLDVLAKGETIPHLAIHQDFMSDPISSFGVVQAKRHRERGIDFCLFLGLMKYYRKSYIDLIRQSGFSSDDKERYREIVALYFDRVELAFSTEWTRTSESERNQELQKKNIALNNEKNKYLTIFESSPNPIFIIDNYDKVINFNFAAARIFYGIDTPGKQYYTGESTEIPPIIAHDIKKFEASHDSRLFIENEVETADGKYNFVVCMQKLLDVSGKFQGSVFILNNITQLKILEEERQNLSKQLLHVQKLESLGVLAGGIAHDFNNILVGIMGYADLTLMNLPSMSPDRDNIEQIIKSAKSASDLTKNLLAYAGKGKYTTQCLKLDDAVIGLEHLLLISISKSCVLKFNFSDNLPSFEGDISQIQQIILNLVINASDAINNKSGVISITTGLIHIDQLYLNTTLSGENLEEGYYVTLEVSDNGSGMDEETCARIFDPFFTTKFTGRGLGLSAVIGIVRGHRGAIKVYSEPGKGTSFKILLPAVEVTSERCREKKSDLFQDVRGSGTVLVVDDEETVRTVAKMLIMQFGYKVLTAEDGLDALKIYQENMNEISVVILDMTMPHMDGSEAYTELRRINPDIKVILTSGYNESDSINRFTGKGLVGFIQKPYRPMELAALLKEHTAPI
ncbi:MAG: response regulator [Oryzomonas sp.]|uniref:hybrid sensor histidine kinase/response regulator n=1 Tax=Oryzomonas sp. TaxID=2855186 RepID=UPI00284FC9E5|nr:response regulator [Oryzomonas sp.]MDR3581366.1 response regulator [Oryzomonas sp.]